VQHTELLDELGEAPDPGDLVIGAEPRARIASVEPRRIARPHAELVEQRGRFHPLSITDA